MWDYVYGMNKLSTEENQTKGNVPNFYPKNKLKIQDFKIFATHKCTKNIHENFPDNYKMHPIKIRLLLIIYYFQSASFKI